MATTDVKREILRRRGALQQNRSTWVTHWREIRDYLLPEHGLGLGSESSPSEETDGSKRMQYIYDATASRALDVLAAGLHAGLTSPSRPWFKLDVSDPELADKAEVKSYLYACEQRMFSVLSKSNFYKSVHHAYYELGGFGTAAVAMLEDFDKVVHCRPFTAGEYLLANDAQGKVDTVYRDIWMTAAQMIQEFGEENCSRPVVNSFKNGAPDQTFKVIHAVEPHDDRIDLPEAKGKPWRSVYLEEGGEKDKLLRVRGYESFPFLCPRWFVVGNQVYGRSPGMRMLPDVKQLQKETEKKLTGLDKLVSPPVVSPTGNMSDLTVNTFPDGVSYDASPDGKALRPLYQVNLPLQYVIQDIADLRDQTRKGAFNDLFLMLASNPSNPKMTAREVAERHEEKLIMLGPTLERLHDELLSPAIDRLFAIMNRVGLLPDPPPELVGKDLKIEFISILAQAQKMAGIGAMEQALALVGSIAAIKPEVVDKVDFDEAIEVYFDRIGVPPNIVVPDEQVLQTRQRRAQQQQAAATASMAKPAADAASAAATLAGIDQGQNTALSTLLGQAPVAPPY